MELKGHGYKDIPLKCIINIDNQKILEYVIYGEDDVELLRSMDKEGVMPFH